MTVLESMCFSILYELLLMDWPTQIQSLPSDQIQVVFPISISLQTHCQHQRVLAYRFKFVHPLKML